jgi:hypothetical protein
VGLDNFSFDRILIRCIFYIFLNFIIFIMQKRKYVCRKWHGIFIFMPP